jgi:hypothetical protein
VVVVVGGEAWKNFEYPGSQQIGIAEHHGHGRDFAAGQYGAANPLADVTLLQPGSRRGTRHPLPPTAIRETEAAASSSPVSRNAVSRSPSKTRASRIVTAGYREVITAVIASRP